jgi:hypothetical protein
LPSNISSAHWDEARIKQILKLQGPYFQALSHGCLLHADSKLSGVTLTKKSGLNFGFPAFG